MNKQEINRKRTAIINLLDQDMYNTALYGLKELVDNLTIGDVNENERIFISHKFRH